jgi:hypothetical protein
MIVFGDHLLSLVIFVLAYLAQFVILVILYISLLSFLVIPSYICPLSLVLVLYILIGASLSPLGPNI